MFTATVVLAVSTVALASSADQDPSAHAAKPAAVWPHNEGRMFATASKEAWALVQARLKELGLPAAKTDRENQLLITKWASFGDGRVEWLPRPTVPQQYSPERVRFEVFVSPFVEPARIYVGSLMELRLKQGKVSGSLLYNHRALNLAALGALAKALGQEGFEIPPEQEERDRLAASSSSHRPGSALSGFTPVPPPRRSRIREGFR